MQLRALLVGVLLLAACQEVLVLPRPPGTGAGAQLLLWMQGDVVARLDAADVQAGEAIIPGAFSRLSASPEEPLSLVQLGFGCTLRELGLPPQELALTEQPATAGVEVPPPSSTQVLDLASAAPSWVAAEELDLSATLRRLPLEDGSYCRNMGAELGVGINARSIKVGDATPSFEEMEVEWAIRTRPGEGLVSLRAVKLSTRSEQFVLGLEGMRPTELRYRDGGRLQALPRGRIAQASDDSLWFVSQGGDVAHGTTSSGLEVVGHIAWFGTAGSTLAAHVTNVWVLHAGGEERLFVGYTHDDGGFLDATESAILAYVPGGPPELVDSAPGFGYPSIAAAADGSVWIAGLDLLHGHLRHGRRRIDGTWLLDEATLPPRPDESRPEGVLAPTHVEVLPDQRLRLVVARVFMKEVLGLRHLSVPNAAIVEGSPDTLAWLPNSDGAGAITTDAWELPDSLLVFVSLDANNVPTVSLIQHGVRGCGGVRMHPNPAYEERLGADNYDRLRAFSVPLDEDSVAVLASYSQVPAYIFRRPKRAPQCLIDP